MLLWNECMKLNKDKGVLECIETLLMDFIPKWASYRCEDAQMITINDASIK